MDWSNIIKRCNKENRLKPPFGRNIHLIDNKYICKITNGDFDFEHYFYVPKDKIPSISDLRQRDLNEITILKQIKDLAPVPKLLYYDEKVIIQEYIDGENLMDIWKDFSNEDIENIKNEIVEVMKKLMEIKIETIKIKLDSRYDNAFNGKTYTI